MVEVFLTAAERLELIKASLMQVIKSVDGKNVDRTLEAFFVHIEAAGPEIKLNSKQISILEDIRNRKDLLLKSTQLLGSLDDQKRKEKFLDFLQNALADVLEGGSQETVLALERIVASVTCGEYFAMDKELMDLCFNIENCVKETLVSGESPSRIRLGLHSSVLKVMRNNLV